MEKSSLGHDIWWIYVSFNIVGLWKKAIEIIQILHFDKSCKTTLKINDYRKSVSFANNYGAEVPRQKIRARDYGSYARVRARIFTNFFLVINLYLMS